MQNSQKQSFEKQSKNVSKYITLSEASIRQLRINGINEVTKLEKAFNLDQATIDRDLKKWEKGINEVGVTASDTGKKLDEASKKRYIEL